jgi:oxygen-independent coproporphyrinogen-3 oxidase
LENLNLDLIFGIPGQTLESWRESLRQALALEPAHLACYGLTYEPGTALTKQLQQARVTPCDDGIEAEMLLLARDVLTAAGFEHYEISNFARPGRRCAHNVIYWMNAPYIGVGPSAAGFIGGRRYKNIANHVEYVRRIQAGGHAEAEAEVIDDAAAAIETLMMRMRLLDGLHWGEFEERTGVDLRRAASAALERLSAQGLVELQSDRLTLTRRGILFADGIIAELAVALDHRPGVSLPIVQTSKPGKRP